MLTIRIDSKPRIVCGYCGNTKAEARVNGHLHQHVWVKYSPVNPREALG